jgi:hypothetical protein
MNTFGYSLRLHDKAGIVVGGSQTNTITALAISATLNGDLTFTGIVDATGAAVSWVVPAGTTAGVYAAPGAKSTGGNAVWYSLADPTDADKVVIAWAPPH